MRKKGQKDKVKKSGTERTRRIYRLLKKRILYGHYMPRQRLVETTISKELAVNRMVLRDALKRLALEGLVVSEPYKGSYVSEISIDDAYEAYQLHAFLEGSAAFLATARISNEEVIKIESLIDKSKGVDPQDGEKWQQYNLKIHKLINWRCGNSKLKKAIGDNLKNISYWFIILSASTAEEITKRNNEHDVILRAIKERNPFKVRELMEGHIMGATEDLKQRLENTFSPLNRVQMNMITISKIP